jgi:transcriptional regulator with XRE-family HTH domain
MLPVRRVFRSGPQAQRTELGRDMGKMLKETVKSSWSCHEAKRISRKESLGTHQSKEPKGIYSGLALLVRILTRRRKRKRMTLAGLARRAHVSVEKIQKFEAYQVNSIGLMDLLAIGTALGSKLTVELAPIKPTLPRRNAQILAEFDRLLKGRKCNPFIRNSRDKEHKGLYWDIVGDKERNWLFVVVCNPKKKARFGTVTDNPGGWAIAGQLFGIDAKTNQIADRLAKKLLKRHRAELAGIERTRSTKQNG